MSNLTFAITDVHGCNKEFNQLLQLCASYAVEQGCADPLYVFLGDYVDRGPDSAGVIYTIRSWADTNRVVALKGNHDDMMVKALTGYDDGYGWAINGYAATVKSYGYGYLLGKATRGVIFDTLRADEIVARDVQLMNNFPTSFEDEHRYFVHAGIRPGLSLDEQNEYDKLWIRGPFLNSSAAFPKHVVHGHSPNRGIHDARSNRTNLDSMAFGTGVLTAGVFNDQTALPIGFLATSFTATMNVKTLATL